MQRIIAGGLACIAIAFIIVLSATAASPAPNATPQADTTVSAVMTVRSSPWDTQLRHQLAVAAAKRLHAHEVRHAALLRRRTAEQRASRAAYRRSLVGSCTSSNWRSTMTADEIWIDTRESGLNPHSVNASSGAWGLGQLMAYPHTYDPCLQLKYQRAYIAERYGSEDNAVAFWRAHNWY